MENENNEDDQFSIVCGDLGLGQSSKISYLNQELMKLGRCHNTLSVSDSCLNSHLRGLNFNTETHNKILSKEDGWDRKFISCDHSRETLLSEDTTENSERSNTGDGSFGIAAEDFPTYADVPYGTSLRQQKKLFKHQIDSLRRQFASSLPGDTTACGGIKQQNLGSWRSNSLKLTGKEIEAKLMVSLEEMEELKIELDACQKKLDAKYRAVAILKQQADLADIELKKTERRASETSKRLEQEVSKLQFELEWRESTFMNSQQTWAERFDSVCQENAILMSKLETRNEELKRANAHRAAISRERDELLALLDVTERLKYEQGKSRVAEDEYSTFTSSELAVLGACKCRITSPEPCGCAHAAVHMRKEVARLREELELCQKRRAESNLTVDAYRTAFEEQLAKSRSLAIQLSHIATLSSRAAKAKAAIKWLIQVLSDDDYVPPRPMEQGLEAEKGNSVSTMSIQEMVTVLTEMVHEKNEALAHQRLAAQVLANKLHMYEKREGKRSEVAEKGTHSKLQAHKKKKNKEAQITHDDAINYVVSESSGFCEDNSCDRLENVEGVNKYVLHPYNKEDDGFHCASVDNSKDNTTEDDNLPQMSDIGTKSHSNDNHVLVEDVGESCDSVTGESNHLYLDTGTVSNKGS